MKYEIILSGFGGQGILFAGNLLALAAMLQGFNTTFLPVYGPEMRGGTCHCTVIISKKEIASPLVYEPGFLILFNLPSFIKFLPRLKKGGMALVNSDLVKKEEISDLKDFSKGKRILWLPFNTWAEEIGFPLALNMCALGAFNGLFQFFTEEVFKNALMEMLGKSKSHLFEMNFRAYKKGFTEIQNYEGGITKG
ncbi:MAG: 2-oxoacid:acceptor oxidoreductase family protein [Caldimicrobium sp.]